MNFKDKVWGDPVWSKVIAGIIGFILLSIYSILKEVNYSEFSIIDYLKNVFVLIILVFLIYGVIKIFSIRNLNLLTKVPKLNNGENLKCSIYTNLGTFYKVTKRNSKEVIFFEGNCKITNISKYKIIITSIKFKDNHQGIFSISGTSGENYILPGNTDTLNFRSYIDASYFRIKKDIVTYIIITDNLAGDYLINNIRFRRITEKL